MQRENRTERKAQPSTRGEVVCIIDKVTRGTLRGLIIFSEATSMDRF